MTDLDDLERRCKAWKQYPHNENIPNCYADEVLALIERCRGAETAQTAAERNLACIADMLNTWARELNQREVTDYLGPCVLRDALKELSGYANKKRYEAESRLARWSEALEKVRAVHTDDYTDAICSELTRLATEKR